MNQLPVLTCDGCGACCMHMSVPPYDSEELDLLKARLPQVYADYQAAMETRTVQLKFVGTDEVPCAWFDMVTRRCRHNEYKPEICDRFMVGHVGCLDIRRRAGIDLPAGLPQVCPWCGMTAIQLGKAIAGEPCDGCRCRESEDD